MKRPGVAGQLCAMAGIGIMSAASPAAVQYKATDLGRLPGHDWVVYEPMALNGNGWVAGRAYDPGFFGEPFRGRAFLYRDGGMTDLGTLGGQSSQAFGINDAGQVVGASYTAAGDLHAFIYEGGTITDLGTLPGGTSSSARGINSRGQVVGVATTAGGDEHAFLYRDGVMTDLGTLLPGATQSHAYSINDLGQIVGVAKIPGIGMGYQYRPFLYDHGSVIDLSATGPGGLLAEDALAISATGWVTGRGATLPDYSLRGFLYGQGRMVDLGVFPGGDYSSGRGVNAAGHVVGDASSSDRSIHAFVYQQGVMTNLNTLLVPGDIGWTLLEATAINDQGQIVGWGGNPQGESAVYLLTPIPEPGVFGAAGFAVLTLRRRRERRTATS